MEKEYSDTDDFISIVAQKARFTKGDVKIILNAIIETFEEFVKNKRTLKVRSFGKLYTATFPARRIPAFTDKNGLFHKELNLPETGKVIFRLSNNIRFAGQVPEIDSEKTLDNIEDM